MGSVFGVIAEEEHAYAVVEARQKYEVRAYPASALIETDKEGFMKLAGYIGVISKPENERKQKIAMTTPVLTNDDTMKFVLPAAEKDPPQPTHPDVKVVARSAERAAVLTYYGGWNEDDFDKKKNELLSWVKKDNLAVDADRWEWRRHNPPWTLPWFKKNEVYLPIRE